MGSTITTYRALLKERYLDSDDVVEKLVYPDNVLLSRLEKRGDEGMVGFQLPVPLITALPQGIGGVFSTAQTNAGGTGGTIRAHQWAITAGDYYGVVHIGDKIIEASRSNNGAFLANKMTEIDGLYEEAGEALSIYAWGNGGQALGRIAAINGNVVSLVEPADAQNFEIGMLVVASNNDGSTSTDTLIDSADQTAVTAVNRSQGTVTFTVADLSGLAVGDYLFREGDFFGDTGTIVMKGIQCFLTSTDAPPTLWGITDTVRATDPQRFGGCRVATANIQGRTMEEKIKILMAQMAGRFKAKMPTAGYLHPEDFQVLETLMTARGVRALEDENTKFGFMKIDIATGSGRIPIYCDRHCPKGTFFAFRMEDFWISSMGELLYPQTNDSLQVLRVTDATDIEYRLISHPLLACRAPKNSGRVPLTS
jgi:hypothetical protein